MKKREIKQTPPWESDTGCCAAAAAGDISGR
jgi:hypothetical protein